MPLGTSTSTLPLATKVEPILVVKRSIGATATGAELETELTLDDEEITPVDEELGEIELIELEDVLE